MITLRAMHDVLAMGTLEALAFTGGVGLTGVSVIATSAFLENGPVPDRRGPSMEP